MICVGKRDWMSVVWAATSPESGLFDPVERRSEVKDLSDRFNDLRSRGQGYVEVRSPDREFPVLILAFRDDHAVVHLMSDTERMSLLVGDGTVPSGAEVELPIMDDLAVFMGDFVLDIDRAWDLVHDFTQTWAAGPAGEWCEL
ncbi:hypothetical protein P2Q00_49000 [Streptomyces coacervatus]|nr:hypothetical protein [Streptomyces coacervatus]MDF2273276.1 hypothetical protein [Streptomyces coacervatus]